ncbi:MAG: calcium-binding protein [Nocardioides sp.]
MRVARIFVAVLPALVLAGVSVPPAQAAVTSTGVRCTVVGTPGDDVLTGTPGRDVVCGLGGDDVISTGGGQDLVDAGAGADTVRTGSGADRVLAGPGADDVTTGSGADTVAAGRGADDVATGGGDDTVVAGPGADTLEGGGGSDDLEGQGGDDDLTGDAGADDLDGGTGTNICIVDAVDESRRCRYDEQPPVMVETRIDPGTVDVTHQDADVVVRVHASDDTGIEDVQLQLAAGNNGVALDVPPFEQVEGDQRDGWWQATVTVPRWTRPATLLPTVILRDRLDRTQFDESSPARLQVLDDDPDLETPRLWLRSPVGSDPVDVTSSGADVTVSVRATDVDSGVRRIDLCLSKPADADHLMLYGICADDVARAAGSVHDGVWTATLRIPKGDMNGTWNVTAYASDRAGSGEVDWLGPDAYRRWIDLGACCSEVNPFPDGAGALTVIGADDRTAAWSDQVTATPAEVDTFQVDALTHVSVHALDAAGEAVTRIEAVLLADSDAATAPQFDRVDLAMTAGSATDGTWEGDLVLPRSTPPGTYHVLVFVDDVAHSTGFVGSSYPGEKTGWRTLDGDPVVVVRDTRP